MKALIVAEMCELPVDAGMTSEELSNRVKAPLTLIESIIYHELINDEIVEGDIPTDDPCLVCWYATKKLYKLASKAKKTLKHDEHMIVA